MPTMDIGLLSALAGLLGISARDPQQKIETIRKHRTSEKIQQRRKNESTFAKPQNIIKLLSAFYGRSLESNEHNLGWYCLRVGKRQNGTTIYTTQLNLTINTPPLQIPMGLLPRDSPEVTPLPITSQEKKYAPEVLNRIDQMGIKIWNAPTYRLLEFGRSDIPWVQFTETNFFSGRFTSGLIYDETVDALVQGNIDLVLENPNKYMPLRMALLPTRSDLFAFKNRTCIGGVGVVFAFARAAPEDDFVIPLQIRSYEVSANQGVSAVLPQGFHQPMAGQEEEVNIHWTVFRELYPNVA